MMKRRICILACLLLGMVPALLQAGITVLNSATGSNTTYQGGTSISFSFSGLDLTGGDKLVVTIGAQSTNAGLTNGVRVWSSVTFDGQAMTKAARFGCYGSTENSQYQSGIYYLDDLTGLSASSNLTISASTLAVRGASATAWVLSGTAAGHGAGNGSLGASTSLTTTSDDSWVIAHATVAGTTAPTAQAPLTAGLTVVNPYNGSSQTGNGTGTQTVTTAGSSLTPSFDIGATTVAAEFLAGNLSPSVSLSGDHVVSNATPGTLVGTLSMANTNGTFTYAMETDAGDDAYFDIANGTTNLRTKVWMNKASYAISIVGTESGGGGLVVTNDFTITVNPATETRPTFVVTADVQAGAVDGTVIGTAETMESGATFSISSGRSDLFYFDGASLKLTNAADWGGIGTTNYVTLQAVVGTGTNELVVAAGVVSVTTRGTVFRFR